MPRGSKDAYTDKQKRQAEHIEEGYKKEGISDDEAERRAWATVNKESGGGKKSGLRAEVGFEEVDRGRLRRRPRSRRRRSRRSEEDREES